MKKEHIIESRWNEFGLLAFMVLCGFVMSYGCLVVSGVHPTMVVSMFICEIAHSSAVILPHRIGGLFVVALGATGIVIAGRLLAKGSAR